MDIEQRCAVLQRLNQLFCQYEDQYDLVMEQMGQEVITDDFFEDLYDILYDFLFDEMKLLARLMKLMEWKIGQYDDKLAQNRYN